ncbi:MAG: sulfurtransferase [Actinomycetota bacterium]|nr:sulfurtransferase [Actinomycetota bacterium]
MSRDEFIEGGLVGQGEFANPDSLATVEWLHERLDDPTVKIVDARYIIEVDDQGRVHEVPGRDSFVESHIPGAVFLDLDTLENPASPAHIVGVPEFSDGMSRLGIGSDHEVVVYDTDGGVWSARLWWALRHYGHKAVRILDGGFGNWTREGLPTETGERPIERSTFAAHPEPGLRVDIGDVVSALSEPHTVIVDGLTEPFHAGNARLFPHLPGGHIPGAINMPAPDNLDPETGRLLPVAELVARWKPVIGSADRIITYCGAGMYGAFDLFVLNLLGYDAALYDGSWEEWAANEDLPIATAESALEDVDG